ncbi:hypothetical protein [Intrasporangium calvum]|uniref:hypothetical protein n=1 Tax=Intrasporangium calvum TaxID=53358 RepID=UPI0002F576AC|nr:hypothetical protein [Intrasporangium calvum]
MGGELLFRRPSAENREGLVLRERTPEEVAALFEAVEDAADGEAIGAQVPVVELLPGEGAETGAPGAARGL